MANVSDLGASSVYTYVTFTLLFFIAKFHYFPEDNFYWVIVFFVLSFFIQFINNVYLTARPELCGKAQNKVALYATFMPWTFVFGLTILCILSFPGWLRVFSNTFGLTAAQMNGSTNTLYSIFNGQAKNAANQAASHQGSVNIELMKAIDSVYNDPSVILNELDSHSAKKIILDNIESVNRFFQDPTNVQLYPGVDRTLLPVVLLEWASLNKLVPNIIPVRPSQENVRKLHDVVMLKENVGYFVWFILVGSLSVLISTNTLLATGCGDNPGATYDIVFGDTGTQNK
jgi:hypothetical protein